MSDIDKNKSETTTDNPKKKPGRPRKTPIKQPRQEMV